MKSWMVRSVVVLGLAVCTMTGCASRGDAAGEASRAAGSEAVIQPPYAPARELAVGAGVPRGRVHRFVMKSQDSALFPGISKERPGEVVPYERAVNVYVPAQYVPGEAAPFIVVQDGDSAGYRDTIPPALDTLIAEHRVPVMIAVMVNSGGGDGFGSERGLEYDTVSDRYTRFIETEVLPEVSKRYGVTLTADPEGRATMGGSSGAACAFTMAWFHPELYRRVLSYSGTYVNQENPPHPEITRGAWEYHQTLIPGSPRKPIRVWLHVSEHDLGAERDESTLHNWVLANEHMAAALRNKGYAYRYVFAKGAGHVDGAVVKQTLPSALEWLWDGYRGK